MEFDYIGSHCAVSHCNQKDFLPFLCDGCHKKFCLSHRCYKSHSCPTIPKGIQVIICPLCSQSIEIRNEQEANQIWNLHYTQNKCHKQEKSKIKCPSLGCKKELNEINSIFCNVCSKQVCLAHRFSDQHSCRPAKSSFNCSIF